MITTEVQYSRPNRIQCEPSLQLPMSKRTATLAVVQLNDICLELQALNERCTTG